MKKLLLYIAGLAPFLLTSCEQDITLDVPPYQPKLAVYCVLYPDSLPTLFLNRSKAYFDYSDVSQETMYIENAQVLVEDMDTHQVDTLTSESGYIILPDQGSQYMHYYAGHYRTKPGGHYRLTVNHEGSQLTGETKVPSAINLAASDISSTSDSADFQINYHFKVRVHDPAGEENSFRLYAQDSRSGGYPYLREFQSDLGNNGKDIGLPFEYDTYVGGWGGQDTFSMTFQVEDFTRSTADYIESVYSQQGSDGNPFIEPVIIKHNVAGGLGVFGAAAKGNSITIKVR